MVYVNRDSSGNIACYFSCRQYDGQEEVPGNHAEIVAFNEAIQTKRQFTEQWITSDSRMPRISEDAIRALITKGILSRDDFEPAALDVLDSRDALRKKLK